MASWCPNVDDATNQDFLHLLSESEDSAEASEKTQTARPSEETGTTLSPHSSTHDELILIHFAL
eukprot:751075-Amphidinium_carterae.1